MYGVEKTIKNADCHMWHFGNWGEVKVGDFSLYVEMLYKENGGAVLLWRWRGDEGEYVIHVYDGNHDGEGTSREERYVIPEKSAEYDYVEQDAEWGRIARRIEREFGVHIYGESVFDHLAFYDNVDDPYDSCPRCEAYEEECENDDVRRVD